MLARLRTIVAFVVLVSVGCGASELADAAGAAAAMACCAKTDYSCAGLSAPDTCCQRMHHAASHPTPSTIAGAQDLGGPATIVAAVLTQFLTPRSWQPSVEFTRPHDPPHLHTYALLI